MTNLAQVAQLDIVVVGTGRVGRAVVAQLVAEAATILDRSDVAVRVIGMVDRSATLLDRGGLSESRIREALEAKERGAPLASLAPHADTLGLQAVVGLAAPGVAFVDTTADPDTGTVWRSALDAGASVVLANKLPLCRPWGESGALFEHPRLRYEATVGAGLPVISTLRRLLDSGDRVERIRASLSGTLAYLMNRVSSGGRLSAAVTEAVALGYAEPDPREDLRGADVARKALILARTLGWAVEPEAVGAESLFPACLDGCALTMFLDEIASLDRAFASRVSAAAAEGKVLRYVATVSPPERSILIGLQPFDRSDPFALATGTENRIEFRSERYGDDALSICGPGAGPQVTAMGVVADLLDVARIAPSGAPS